MFVCSSAASEKAPCRLCPTSNESASAWYEPRCTTTNWGKEPQHHHREARVPELVDHVSEGVHRKVDTRGRRAQRHRDHACEHAGGEGAGAEGRPAGLC